MKKDKQKPSIWEIGMVVVALICVIGSIGKISGSSSHGTCIEARCRNDRALGSAYCYLHKPFTENNTSKSKTSYSSSKSSSTKSSSSSSSSSKSSKKTSSTSTKKTSSKKSYTMPDCDDYEDYDEFMDDWDGYMPDGSDAEDYWENW